MPLFFLGTREWRNRQTRTVQVRVPVMEWGFNSPLAHDETADPSGSAVFVFPGCCLRPHGCSGRRVCFVRPGCLLGLAAVCAGGWRPAREIATREPSARRVVSKPGQAPPPPTSTAASSCRCPPAPQPGPSVAHQCCGLVLWSLRRPPHLWGWVAVVWFGASSRSPARSRRRPPARRPGPLVPPAPHTSVEVGVLRHAKPSGGVSSACRRLGWRHSPRFEAVRWQLGVVRRPKHRPPR